MKKEMSKAMEKAIEKKLNEMMSKAIQKSIDEGLDPENEAFKKYWALDNLKLSIDNKGGEVLNIKVFCKTCNWTGQATVGKRGFDLEKYKCPKCGHSLKRGKGSYDFNSESAQLIGHFWP